LPGSLSFKRGARLQRLFSTFPGAWPGVGLLLLRVSAGVPLLVGGVLEIRAESGPLAAAVLTILVGILLFAGLWTPIAGVLLATLQLWAIFSRGTEVTLHLIMTALGISLVMLGPGAWSIDARLFGRKRIDISGF
jgi:putative oxidoreductase